MPTETLTTTARIIEVFSSVQGEGVFVGQPHLFVRFWDCNLKCAYCDTEYRGPYTEMTRAELEGRVSELLVEQGPHEAVSLTGGEPLLWRQFLTGFLPWLRQMGQRTYLETNGTLPTALEAVLPWVDVIAMDLKPPSSTADRAVWQPLLTIYRELGDGDRLGSVISSTLPNLFVKVVVTPQTTDADIVQAAALLADADRTIPLILQPVTPCGVVTAPPVAAQLHRWIRIARARLDDVRVIPQMHKVLGLP